MPPDKHYFAFIDETGTTSQERFFAIGLLVVKETDKLSKVIKPIAEQIHNVAILNKKMRIEVLQKEKNIFELANLARSSRTFELKYDRISFSNQTYFSKLIQKYFSITDARFTAIVVDKDNPNFKPTKLFPGTWEAYLTYSAMALAREAVNLSPSSFSVLADEISRPSVAMASFEESLKNKFLHFCKKRNLSSICNIHCTSLESNAHLLIQLVDVLLGSVVFMYKNEAGLISESLNKRKSPVVQDLLKSLNKDNFGGNLTCHKPNYFSVWEVNWDS